jgi:carboxyl-terminal processing protease
MKFFQVLTLALTFGLTSAEAKSTEPNPGQVCISVGRLLEQGHYTRRKIDDAMSRELLKNYLEALDYTHLLFTQKDVDRVMAKYGNELDDDILFGNPAPAFEIFDLYLKRAQERVAKIKLLLKENFDFKSNRTVEINRQKSPWPKDEAEADKLWSDRIEGELLQEKLATHPIDAPVKIVTRRYDQMLRNIREQTREDIVKTFLSALAQTDDPHSEYLSKSELENFSINMRLSLVGIGAVLRSDDGYAKILDLVPGGPAQVDGRLKVNDRICAVAQGDKDFVDVVGLKLDKVVEMIRGKKGTTVRLQVIPSRAADPSKRKLVEIVRDEIKLKDQEAKAEIIETPDASGQVRRLGWITLPSFYADMEHAGSKGAKSTTRDVRALLTRLKAENIGGLVIDLRRNGGGSLEEAVNLTGLFIKRGPVVQAKDSNGNIHVSRDRDQVQVYDGPLVVLTNKLSASASEIFAAALQDYGRAVIVGDHSTFGKGTVQTMLEIGRFIPFLGGSSSEAGALKLTIQKFYRVAGGSTQLRGVLSDVVLPSPYDNPEIGESALKDPMPYDEVDPVDFDKIVDRPLFLSELRARSAARVAADQEFRYLVDDTNRVKAKLAANIISLNEKVRRAEIAEDKARTERRTVERSKRKRSDIKDYVVTLDNVDKPGLQLVSNDKKADTSGEAQDGAAEDEEEDSLGNGKKSGEDPIRNEALNVLADLIDLSRAPQTASVNP